MEGQSRIDNPQTMALFGTHGTIRKKHNTENSNKMHNMDPIKKRG